MIATRPSQSAAFEAKDPREAVREVVSEIADRQYGADAARRLPAVLRAAVADPDRRRTRDLLHGLLDGRALDGLYSADGVPCRKAVAAALLELGYPWALEIHPDDLRLLKLGHGRRVGSIAVGVVALLSLAWNAPWAVALTRGTFSSGLLCLPFWIGTAHALAALCVAVGRKGTRAERLWARTAYRWLFACILVGPISSIVIGLAAFHGAPELGTLFGTGMLFAAPAMVTAAVAGAASCALDAVG